MNLKQVLYPELVKGTRGDPKVLKFFKELYGAIKFDGKEWIYNTESEVAARFGDPNCSYSVVLARLHQAHKAPVYHVGRDFLDVLSEVPDREIPLKFFPENFFAYISFPEGMVRDEDEAVTGAYVFMGSAIEGLPILPSEQGKLVLLVAFTYVPYWVDSHNTVMVSFAKMFAKVDKEQTVEDLHKQFPSQDYLYTPKGDVIEQRSRASLSRQELTKTLINVVLYITSQDPELLKLTPTHGRTNKEKREKKVGEHLNECTVPVIGVNWNFRRNEREHLYEEGKTFVQTFLRWQACGPNWSEHRHVWVKGHEKRVRRRKEEDDGEA